MSIDPGAPHAELRACITLEEILGMLESIVQNKSFADWRYSHEHVGRLRRAAYEIEKKVGRYENGV